jgi:transposase
MPYSEDLRERVLRQVDSGESKMSAHKTFGVSRSTIDRWLTLRHRTGSLKANTAYRRGPTPTINDLEVFAAFAKRHNSCTLAQMALAWEQESGQKLSLMPFSLALRRIGWTRKKELALPRTARRRAPGVPRPVSAGQSC